MKPARFMGDSPKCLRAFPTEEIFVLHAFQKKSQATPKRDLETARERFAQLKRMLP